MSSIYKFFVVAIFILTPFFMQSAIAQPPPPDPVDIPVDGGLGLLLLAGLTYGAKKIYENKENDQFA